MSQRSGTNATGYEAPWSAARRTAWLLATVLVALGFTVVAASARAALAVHGGWLNHLGSWDIAGGGPGEFANPSAVMVSADGSTVYVADTLNDRVQVLSAEGVYETEWPVTLPFGLARDGNNVLVSSGHSAGAEPNSVVEFSPSGKRLAVWGVSAGDIASDESNPPAGYFSAMPLKPEIQRWRAGELVGGWSVSEPGYSKQIATDSGGNVYFGGNERLTKYTRNGTEVATTSTLPDDSEGPFGLAVDPSDKSLWVAGDGCSHGSCHSHFWHFDRNLNLLGRADTRESAPGCGTDMCSVNLNAKIAIDCRSHLWRVSPFLHRLDEFGDRGTGCPATRGAGPVLALGDVSFVTSPSRTGASRKPSGVIKLQLGCDLRPCAGRLTFATTESCPSGGRRAAADRVSDCSLGSLRFHLPANSVRFFRFSSPKVHALVVIARSGDLPVLIGLHGFHGRRFVRHLVKLPLFASSLSLACPGGGAEGAGVTVSGKISPKRKGRVTIVFTSASAPSVKDVVTSSTDGSYSDKFVPGAAGPWSVSAESVGDHAFAGARAKSCGFGVTHSDFGMAVSPDLGTVVQGGSTSTNVSTAVSSGVAQPLTLSASGLPSGASANFSPPTISSGGASTLTISTSSSTPAGMYAITVSATGPYAAHNVTYTLTVSAPPAKPTPSDFSIAVNPPSGSAGFGSSLTATVSTTVTSGNTQSVTLSASGAPQYTTVSFSPNPIAAGSSSTMTVTPGANTAPGTYTITITGTGTSATHSTTYTFTKT